MKIKRLELTSFRNYERLETDLEEGTNIFYGNNAQGKTNILEGIYLTLTTRSHKKSRDSEMIKFGEDEAHLRVYLNKRDIDYKIDMHLNRGRKKFIAINGLPIKKAAELLGIANIVFFSPEDLNIIKNSPSERRRFIDMELSQLDKVYLSTLTGYMKTLEQKNALLRDGDNGPLLDVFDEKLFEFGSDIIRKRQDFIRDLNDILKEKNRDISGNDEVLSCSYEPDTEIEGFEKSLKEKREYDIRHGSTSVGPHRDDIRFTLNDTDLRKYGSQGQVRTASLSVKLSEIELVKKRTGDDPILMLDDVLSELDSKRQKLLLNSFGNIQTLITCTGLDEFIKNGFSGDSIYYVENGKVEKE